jgi:prepilin-type N-terminal cleavage/methylation domain-containing protein
MNEHYFGRCAAMRPAGGRSGEPRGAVVTRNTLPRELRAFTLIELLTVVAIIGILTAISMPAVRSLGKNNDQSQGANLVRSMISTARSIAISQHRMAGVVFFEETSKYSMPVHGGQTAMQLIVEEFNQGTFTAPGAGMTGFSYYNTGRQYLPAGVKLAALTDASGTNVETGDAAARCILFDANGQLIMLKGLATYDPSASTKAGEYPTAFGDWKFLLPNGKLLDNTTPKVAPASSPGFFLYNKSEYEAAKDKITWLKKNSTVIIVNGNTGGVLR